MNDELDDLFDEVANPTGLDLLNRFLVEPVEEIIN